MKGKAGQKGQECRSEDLQGAAGQDFPAHAGDARNGELDADGEQEQDDADLGHHFHVVASADEPDAVGTEDDAGGQESHNDRESELLKEEDDGDGEGEDDEQFPQQRRWLGHPFPLAVVPREGEDPALA